jgi:hypothetical protein
METAVCVGRLTAVELSMRELGRECAGIRRRVSRASTRAGQIAAEIKARKKLAARSALAAACSRGGPHSHTGGTAGTLSTGAGDVDHGHASSSAMDPRLMREAVDPASWPVYFSEAELDTAIKVGSCTHCPDNPPFGIPLRPPSPVPRLASLVHHEHRAWPQQDSNWL